MKKWPGIIRGFAEFMPVEESTEIITLEEGNTPLIPVPKLAGKLGLPVDLYLKFDGANPTGSFKDRGMTLAVTKAREEGSQAIICASTGNTSAAAAAYGARADLKTIVIVPAGNIALGKLAQALIHGAEVIPIRGNFDRALELVREICSRYPVTLVNSLNPYRIEGQKSAAFEICRQLGRAPEILAIPVGNAGNITAYWQGFQEYRAVGKIDRLPKMWGFEAAGAAAITRNKVIEQPETVASAIRIGNPVSWERAVEAARQSEGLIAEVSDPEILEAYRELATLTGIFVEPASAASLAGIKKLARRELLSKDSPVVAVLTGQGLKDPDTALKEITNPEPVEASLESVLERAGI